MRGSDESRRNGTSALNTLTKKKRQKKKATFCFLDLIADLHLYYVTRIAGLSIQGYSSRIFAIRRSIRLASGLLDFVELIERHRELH